MSWQKNLSDTVTAINSIADTVIPQLISGKIISVEESVDSALIKLDQSAGIDYLCENDIGIRTVASRVQWGRAWNTFTIRWKMQSGNKTEYQKRMEQISNGYLYPHFTMQAYFDYRENNRLLSIAIMQTLDLYDFIKNYPDKIGKNKADNEFLIVRWGDIVNAGYKIRCLHY